jgi:uncharacterized membrane protein YphA (DoxX/SURF4 family)
MMLQNLDAPLSRAIAPVMTSPVIRWLGLLGLCSAYLQGSLMKLFDFGSAIAEMEHFGLRPAGLMAAIVIVFELVCSACVLTGFCRWLGALALAVFTVAATFLALRFWQIPPGPDRMMATNGFFEHLGLVGGFVIVAWHDLQKDNRVL